MDKAERIQALHKHFDRQIPKHITELLEHDRYLESDEPDDVDERVARTRLLLDWFPESPPPKVEPSDLTIRLLATHEALRRDAISEYWAKQAAGEPNVVWFRREVLAGRLLAPEEAVALLTSPAAALISAQELRSEGIDPARHIATIASQSVERDDRGFVTYSGVVHAREPAAVMPFERGFNGGVLWASPSRPLGQGTFKVAFDDSAVDVICWTFSVLDDLRKTAAALDDLHFPWRPGEGAWFILTGATPTVASISYGVERSFGTRGARVMIHLSIEPWISVDRVTRLYKDVQNAVLGGHNRPFSERRIELFRFVLRHTNDEGERPPSRMLMATWNEEHPNQPYTNVRNFSRDYWAGARGLIFPAYRPFREARRKSGKARKR